MTKRQLRATQNRNNQGQSRPKAEPKMLTNGSDLVSQETRSSSRLRRNSHAATAAASVPNTNTEDKDTRSSSRVEEKPTVQSETNKSNSSAGYSAGEDAKLANSSEEPASRKSLRSSPRVPSKDSSEKNQGASTPPRSHRKLDITEPDTGAVLLRKSPRQRTSSQSAAPEPEVVVDVTNPTLPPPQDSEKSGHANLNSHNKPESDSANNLTDNSRESVRKSPRRGQKSTGSDPPGPSPGPGPTNINKLTRKILRSRSENEDLKEDTPNTKLVPGGQSSKVEGPPEEPHAASKESADRLAAPVDDPKGADRKTGKPSPPSKRAKPCKSPVSQSKKKSPKKSRKKNLTLELNSDTALAEGDTGPAAAGAGETGPPESDLAETATPVTPVVTPGDVEKVSPARSKDGEKMDLEADDGMDVDQQCEGNLDSFTQQLYDEAEIEEPFFFETDHLALKGNKDYRLLMRTLTTLEAQKIQAVQDLERLSKCQQEGLRNPIQFVDDLQQRKPMGIPRLQQVVPVPVMHWSKYTSLTDSTLPPAASQSPSDKVTKETNPENSDNSDLEDSLSEFSVRGRMPKYKGEKSDTFNCLWTAEEQRKLEELLVKHPAEEVEARRWQKIADEMGNRSLKQVASRVQKYFIKLAKARLPIPGRSPNMIMYTSRGKTKRAVSYKPLNQSTFLQSHLPPVYMPDDDSNDALYSNNFYLGYQDDATSSDEESVPLALQDTEEYRELVQLKRLKSEKIRQQAYNQPRHLGYKCDNCGQEPILGTRYHCLECPDVDLCSQCVQRFQSESHSQFHQIQPIHATQGPSYIDRDYTSFTPAPYSGDYNYLDPNYDPTLLL